jgi:hypothetical protein
VSTETRGFADRAGSTSLLDTPATWIGREEQFVTTLSYEGGD